VFVVDASGTSRPAVAPQILRLGWGLSFTDLYERDGLLRLDAAFLNFLADWDTVLRERLTGARANPGGLAPKAESELLIDLAPHLDASWDICSASRPSWRRSAAGTMRSRRCIRSSACSCSAAHCTR
jgi:hypothetical protein